MGALHAQTALLPDGWASGVRLTTRDGRFAAITTGVEPAPGDERCPILVPGLPNLHSHAFQRGMAGLAEVRGTATDTFWTWRETMYRFALSIGPEAVGAVAAQLYAEMLQAGFTRVGEFHYLHHDRDGRPYADPAELAVRIAAAAFETGIDLTLLPVFYAHSTFGGSAPTDGQRRFICDLDGYARIVEGCRQAIAGREGAVVGLAPHSLRAVTGDELREVLSLAADGPVHMHVAEQVKEVEDCLAWSGRRPVEWLLDAAPVDARWCLIHATHMNDAETRAMARSGAVAGLCPITEASLGDGVFNATVFRDAGGRFGVGSDSNVEVGAAEELRQLEYAQRLARRARNVMAIQGGSTGRALFDSALVGGSVALGVAPEGLREGAPATAVALDASHPALLSRSGDAVLDAWIFAGGRALVDRVWVEGRRVVEGGRHVRIESITARFRAAVEELAAG